MQDTATAASVREIMVYLAVRRRRFIGAARSDRKYMKISRGVLGLIHVPATSAIHRAHSLRLDVLAEAPVRMYLTT